MKITPRKKLIINIVAVAVAVVILAGTVTGIMIPSYNAWRNYYDAAVAEREHQKYLQSLPFELTGITAEKKEEVIYYANGKATPMNSDFTVTAHFTEKGREWDEPVYENEFKISVPDDFASKGGAITVSYAYVPDGEDKEPMEKTADVEVELERVVPVSLVYRSAPYRVYYSDEMPFDPDGITAVATFNDGSTEIIQSREFRASAVNLSAGTESVTADWYRGGKQLSIDVPVTVVPSAEYRDGDIISIRSEGTLYLAEGEQTKNAKPVVRATYENGNRLALDGSKYRIEGNVETASSKKACLISIFLNDNSAVFCKTAAVVRSSLEAENAALNGAAGKTETEYVYGNDGYVEAGSVGVVVPDKGAEMQFIIKSDELVKPDLSVRAAVKEGTVCLADVMTMTVNGRQIEIAKSEISAPADADGKLVFTEIPLSAVVLNKSESNTVKFTFKEGASALAIDRIFLGIGYKGEFYGSTEDYIVGNAQDSGSAECSYEKVIDWARLGGKMNGHGLCSDGTYLYATATTYAEPYRSMVVVKYDLNGNAIAKSAETAAATNEDYAGITYYDGKIIIYYADTGDANACKRLYVNVEDFTEDCTFSDYDGFNFEGLENKPLRDVYYNPTNQKFAVFADGNVHIYDRNMRKVGSVENFEPSDGGAGAKRVTGSAEYIYVGYNRDGVVTPKVTVYDWTGKFIGKLTVGGEGLNEFLLNSGGEYSQGNWQINVQGMTVLNGEFYALILYWPGSRATMCMKISMPADDVEIVPDVTFFEYLAACEDASQTPQFAGAPSRGTQGDVDSTSGYAMGGASDGEFVYLSTQGGGTSATTIYKVDPASYRVVEKSAAFSVGNAINNGDNSRLFIKDGVLYCVAGVVYSVPVNRFTEGCTLTKDAEMTALLAGTDNRLLKSVAWNQTERKFAVMEYTDASTVYILDEDGTKIGEDVTPQYAGMTAHSVCTYGKYFFVSYKADNQSVLPIDFYTFDGQKERTVEVTGISMGTDYNVQAIYLHDGKLHGIVCTWAANVCFHDWTITPNLSVFD